MHVVVLVAVSEGYRKLPKYVLQVRLSQVVLVCIDELQKIHIQLLGNQAHEMVLLKEVQLFDDVLMAKLIQYLSLKKYIGYLVFVKDLLIEYFDCFDFPILPLIS